MITRTHQHKHENEHKQAQAQTSTSLSSGLRLEFVGKVVAASSSALTSGMQVPSSTERRSFCWHACVCRACTLALRTWWSLHPAATSLWSSGMTRTGTPSCTRTIQIRAPGPIRYA
eukprot:scaffold19691_cov22-Tisochrysis_lutea.AAC.2